MKLTTFLVLATLSFEPVDFEADSLGRQSPSELTVTQIWLLHQNEQHQRVIEAVRLVLEDPSTDRTRRAVCGFLEADNLRRLGSLEAAQNAFVRAIGTCRAPGSKVTFETPFGPAAIEPMCELGAYLVEAQELGPFPDSSSKLVSLAWKYYRKLDHVRTVYFADLCIEWFETEAVAQQRLHDSRFEERFPLVDYRDSNQVREMWEEYWALFDVGTSHYVRGLSYKREAELTSATKVAASLGMQSRASFEAILTNFPSAQCFDPIGPWYWRVGDGAREKLPLVQQFVKARD